MAMTPEHIVSERRRPQPRKPEQVDQLWLDIATGIGVDGAGRRIEPILGGTRKNPRLVDLLETARHHHVHRLTLTGAVPVSAQDWLLPDRRTAGRGGEFTPGWSDDGSYLVDNGRGRFTHAESEWKMTVATAREWFPGLDEAMPAAHVAKAHETLSTVVAAGIRRDWPLMSLPGQTGLNIWKMTAPDSYAMDPLPVDIGEEIQATDPQHRIESFVEGRACDCGRCVPLISADTDIPGFAYQDGRFMYQGVVSKQLGAAPATRLRGPEATDLFTQDQYCPARYLITATVPVDWQMIGLVPEKRPGDVGGWHWPNRPGATVTGWVDAAELRIVAGLDDMVDGWRFEILEGIQFAKVNSLYPFADRVGKMLDIASGLEIDGRPISPKRLALVNTAVRHMFRVTVGAMARRRRDTTYFARSASEVPDNAVGEIRRLYDDQPSGPQIYRLPTPMSTGDADTWHPEIAARVWGMSRARVLSAPTAQVERGSFAGMRRYGAMTVMPYELLAIHGDALYTTQLLDWTLPTAIGGGDDGRNGRIRAKGYLPGPMSPPSSVRERAELSRRAEARGWEWAIADA